METGDLKNLAFVVVALLAWVVKIAFERKEQNARRSAANTARAERERQTGTPGRAEPADEEPDVVYGQRPLPPRYTTLAQGLAEPPPPPARPADRGIRSPPPPPSTRGRRTGVRKHVASDIVDRKLEGNLTASAPATVRQSQAGLHARSRLGIDRMGGTKRALRAAILWNEILGPPRSLRGPYRTPAARRRAALL